MPVGKQQQYINETDLGLLRGYDLPSNNLIDLIQAIELNRMKPPESQSSLLVLILKLNMPTIGLGLSYQFIATAMQILSLYIFQRLLQNFEQYSVDDYNNDRGYGIYLLSVQLFICKLVESAFEHQFWFVATQAGVRMSSALVAYTCYKAMRLSPEAAGVYGVGEITTLITVDARKPMETYFVPIVGMYSSADVGNTS
jgi:hypothetical protein